ncbi:hypothetical protein NM688_g6815 [Phlebia brevispora]|uniref:Uncharacterized protein n=1 Tax=Phlebia brevispora TaxID=194682 RepID=A0ACC1SC55_9APHY|nr:hypothetical protein NM688_g6815 [Phlebia brevispora]
MNATQAFSDGEFLTYYGEWVIADFTFLPPLAPGPPPETFTAPELDPSLIGSTVYVTVIETVTGCPPQGETEYVLSSVGVTYAG